MKKLIMILAVALTGCAGQMMNPNVSDVDRSASIPVQDLRPASESKAETFSLFLFSDAYATYRVADELITPPGTILLRHRVYEKYGEQSLPPEIQINHFVVYRNHQSEYAVALSVLLSLALSAQLSRSSFTPIFLGQTAALWTVRLLKKHLVGR